MLTEDKPVKQNSSACMRIIIEQIMLANGGYAPLQHICKEFWNRHERSAIEGKTPEATLREKVQRSPKFVRIGLGVYALRAKQHELPQAPVAKTVEQKKLRRHADIQGMLLEIGNNREGVAGTYTHDKSRLFENRALGKIATVATVPNFTFKHIVKALRYADVVWFNERRFPARVFEVEHSTDFRSALVKFCELQDFRTSFYCVADEARKNKFDTESNRASFAAIKDRCNFLSYQKIENEYETALRETYI